MSNGVASAGRTSCGAGRRRGLRITALVLLAGSVGLAGCGGISAQGKDRIKAARDRYDRGEFAGAVTELDPVLKEFPRAPESAEAYYLRGLAHMRQNSRGSAKSDLTKCIELSQRPDLTARARATLGEIAYDEEDFQTAIRLFDLSLRDMREEPPADEIRYRLAVSLQREARWDEAREQFAVLMHRYKGGRHPEDVRRRFSWPAKSFAIQCGAFQQEASAMALVKRLKDAGLSAREAFEGRGGVPVHIVYEGQYSSYAEARGALPKVRRHVPDGQIVP